MTKYEYKTLDLSSNEGFFRGILAPKPSDITPLLNEQGHSGWRLVTTTYPSATTLDFSKMILVFERPVVEEPS